MLLGLVQRMFPAQPTSPKNQTQHSNKSNIYGEGGGEAKHCEKSVFPKIYVEDCLKIRMKNTTAFY